MGAVLNYAAGFENQNAIDPGKAQKPMRQKDQSGLGKQAVDLQENCVFGGWVESGGRFVQNQNARPLE